MVIDGLEEGINDNTKECVVVIHGAAYANPFVLKAGGRLGQSFGCPALQQAVSGEIINVVNGGTFFYSYANKKGYLATSHIRASYKERGEVCECRGMR